MTDTLVPGRSLTVNEVARRYRVSWGRVKGWIDRGELAAVNVRDPGCGRACFVVTPEALAEFEKRRSAAKPAAPKPKRRKKTGVVDLLAHWS